MTSEQRFDIPDQPENTCPMIDRVLKDIETVFKEMRHYKRCKDVEALHDIIDSIDSALFSTEGVVRDIRTNVENIRAWGQAWKNAAKELEAQVPKVVVPQDISVFDSGYGWWTRSWVCPSCRVRKAKGTAEKGQIPKGDPFCSCGVKLDWGGKS